MPGVRAAIAALAATIGADETALEAAIEGVITASIADTTTPGTIGKALADLVAAEIIRADLAYAAHA